MVVVYPQTSNGNPRVLNESVLCILRTDPKDSPAASERPTSGRSAKTTSPSAPCAKSVMPTVAVLPCTSTCGSGNGETMRGRKSQKQNEYVGYGERREINQKRV